MTTYQEQITTNLDELRRLLWTQCCHGHADTALTATREALASARAITDLVLHKPGDCVPSDPIRRLEPLPVIRRRPRRKGGRR